LFLRTSINISPSVVEVVGSTLLRLGPFVGGGVEHLTDPLGIALLGRQWRSVSAIFRLMRSTRRRACCLAYLRKPLGRVLLTGDRRGAGRGSPPLGTAGLAPGLSGGFALVLGLFFATLFLAFHALAVQASHVLLLHGGNEFAGDRIGTLGMHSRHPRAVGSHT
jgi:hypothetical protein